MTDELFDAEQYTTGPLADRFVVPPFSILDARQGYWQDRKAGWVSLGLRSELGRGGDEASASYKSQLRALQTTGDSRVYRDQAVADPDFYRRKEAAGVGRAVDPRGALGQPLQIADPGFYAKKRDAERQLGREMTNEEFAQSDLYEAPDVSYASGTSIFDPVLCELVYRWFSPRGARVLDPFAGGSVRGIVSSYLGRSYTGIDLSERQIEANREQAVEILPSEHEPWPTWIHGDALGAVDLAGGSYDLIFSCPPYLDLEVYSDDPRDLSTMPYHDFLRTYREIIGETVSMLRPHRFAVFVVANVRDKKTGYYRPFVADTIDAFRDAGAGLYNDCVLVTMVGSLSVRVGRYFDRGRKVGLSHQNVLVFLKGDPKEVTSYCGAVDLSGIPTTQLSLEDVEDLAEAA